MKGLYICAIPKENLNSYYDEWVVGFKSFDFEIFNALNDNIKQLQKLLNPFYYDIIVYGYSCQSFLSGYSFKFLKYTTKFSRATIIGFLENEFRDIASSVDFFESLNVNIIVSQLPQNEVDKLYLNVNKKIVSSPHGMSDRNLIKTINHTSRTIDIGNRSYPYAYYTGNIGRIVTIPKFITRVEKQKLNVDFSQKITERLQTQDWFNFLKKCRSTISCESGSFYLQWNDNIRNKVNNIMKKRPKTSFNFIKNNILKKSKNYINGNIISARHFDAISTGTCNILVEGTYNNILVPDTHYIKLNKNLSNYNDVIEKISDKKETERIAKKALSHCLENHTIKKRIQQLIKEL